MRCGKSPLRAPLPDDDRCVSKIWSSVSIAKGNCGPDFLEETFVSSHVSFRRKCRCRLPTLQEEEVSMARNAIQNDRFYEPLL
jgi:hypothetical protein